MNTHTQEAATREEAEENFLMKIHSINKGVLEETFHNIRIMYIQ